MKAPYKIDATHWSAPDQEWLEYQRFGLGKTYVQIAQEVDCDKGTAQTWGQKLGISVQHFQGSGIHPPVRVGGAGKGVARFYGITREWLYREYVEMEKSGPQIAAEVGTTNHAVAMWIRKHGIPLRSKEERNRRHSARMAAEGNPAWNGGGNQRYQVRFLERSGKPRRCEWCRTDEKVQLHHRDHNHDNADLDNLTWLCGYCNRLEAQLWALQDRGRADVQVLDRQIVIRFIAHKEEST